MHYHLTTLGCQMNHSDSERVRTVVEGMGYAWTDNEQEADLIGILACSVRQKAIDKVYTRIHRWNLQKEHRNLLTFVTGCLLPSDQKRFLKLFDFVFTMNDLPNLPRMIREYGVVSPVAVAGHSEADAVIPPQKGALLSIESLTGEDRTESRHAMAAAWMIEPTPQSRFQAYVPIQNGCNKFCTFCAVPYTRGREVSRRSEAIIDEVRSLVDRGFRSITLLGQNVNSYGRDRRNSELSFAELLRRIGDYGEHCGRPFWVYFTSPHPRDMTPDVIETMARYRCLAKQVHLPLQSGDDKVLLRMNRQHSVERYREIVETVRRHLPQATLFTDIIVGFSGETEAQFENTLSVVASIEFNMAFIAMYSARPGAASWRWPDDVPRDEKKRRYHALNEVVSRQSMAWNRRLVGRELPVLVTGMDRKGERLIGLTEGKVNVRLASDDNTLIGRFVNAAVTDALPFCLDSEPAGVREATLA